MFKVGDQVRPKKQYAKDWLPWVMDSILIVTSVDGRYFIFRFAFIPEPSAKYIEGHEKNCALISHFELVSSPEPTYVLQTTDVFTNVDEAIAKAESMPGITWRVVRQD